VEAVEVRLERYLLGFDTRGMARAPDVEGVRGCRIGRRVQEGAQHVVELLFGDVVEPGATHLFEYATTLAYDRPPPPHLRRAVQTSMRQMIVLVEFTCEPPRRVDRCVWSDDEGTPRVGGRLRLASDCTVHTVFDTPRVGALHGLRWCWS
jgi:hypothetical protein